jgi:hypothetical protein
MQAITIGLPMLSRHPSIACLISTAEAGVTANETSATAINRRVPIKTPARKTAHFEIGDDWGRRIPRGQEPRGITSGSRVM